MKRLLRLVLALLCLLLAGCGAGASREEPGGELEVVCFSAGKADAFLLYTEGGAVVIDCGEKGFGGEILAAMESAGLERLDYLIISHFDKDHVGGAAKVLNNTPVGTVLQSNRPKDSEEYEKYLRALGNAGIQPVTVLETMSFTLDGVTYTVDPPRRNDYGSKSSNNSSLIVSVEYGEKRFLFTGDAQDERLAEFISANRESYDFLKVPYHGHWQETLPELVASVRPSMAVITSSDAEPEDPRTLATLAEAGVEVWLTREGTLALSCDGKAITVDGAVAQAA